MNRSQIALYADGMANRRNLANIHTESAEAKRLSRCYVRREASTPQWVDASTVPWSVRHGDIPQTNQDGSREGFQRNMLLKNGS